MKLFSSFLLKVLSLSQTKRRAKCFMFSLAIQNEKLSERERATVDREQPGGVDGVSSLAPLLL